MRVTSGLTYYPGGPEFDAFIPTAGTTPRPALIMVHGGGWQGGDQTELAPYAMDAATNNGWAAFTVNYRLDGNDSSAWADELHDVQAAIRYIVGSQAQTYGIDPDQVVLLGDSAGANLVALVSEYGTADAVLGDPVGYDPSLAVPLKAVALWSPPTDLAALVATAPNEPRPVAAPTPPVTSRGPSRPSSSTSAATPRPAPIATRRPRRSTTCRRRPPPATSPTPPRSWCR